MIKVRIEQGSDAWHEIRLGRFTGTSMGKLQSGKSTANYNDAITDVVGEILSGVADEFFPTADMIRGTALEPSARAFYEEIHDERVYEVGFCLPDDEFLAEWIGVSTDGHRTSDEGITEFKCPKLKTHLKYLEDGKMPNTYKWQVQAQLWVTGALFCDFMSYYPNMKPFIIRVYPDQEMFKSLENEVRIAIKSVQEKVELYKKYSIDEDPEI